MASRYDAPMEDIRRLTREVVELRKTNADLLAALKAITYKDEAGRYHVAKKEWADLSEYVAEPIAKAEKQSAGEQS